MRNIEKKWSSVPPSRVNPRKRGRQPLLSSSSAATTTTITETLTIRTFCYKPFECAPVEGPPRKRRRLSNNHNNKESKEVSYV